MLYLLFRWVRAHVRFHAVEDFMVETCCVQVATSHMWLLSIEMWLVKMEVHGKYKHTPDCKALVLKRKP